MAPPNVPYTISNHDRKLDQPQNQQPDNILTLLEQVAKHNPYFPLYTFLDRKLRPARVICCQELLTESLRLAGALQSRYAKGEPLILFFQHGPAFVFAYFACLMAGCVAVPLGYKKRRDFEKLSLLMKESATNAVVSTSGIMSSMPTQKLDLGHEAAGRVLHLMMTDKIDLAEQWHRPQVDTWDIACIQVSSGSSGAVKGAAFSHLGMLLNLEKIKQAMRLTTEDRMLSVTSCQEGHGLILHVLLPLYTRVPSYFLDANSLVSRPSSWLEAISKHRCTVSGALGSAYASIGGEQPEINSKRLDFSAWRVAYIGPDVADARALQRFAKRYRANKFSSRNYFHFYGLAETGYFVCGRFGIHLNLINAVPHISVGKLSDSDQWDMVPEQDGVNIDGEGMLRLMSLAAGVVCIPIHKHVSRPLAGQLKALAAAGRAGVRRTVLTDDVVAVKNSELYIRGQILNSMKINGKKFRLEDIESLVTYSFGSRGVTRCVAAYMEDRKEIILAVECGQREMAERWRGVVACMKEIVRISIGIEPDRILLLRTNSLPVSSSGKIMRKECKQLFRSGSLMTRLLPVRGRGFSSD